MADVPSYRLLVKQHVDSLIPIFAKASVGDFSQDVVIAPNEDEFTSLQVGVQIMLDVIREKIKNYEEVNRELKARFEEKSALLQSIGDGVVVLDQLGVVTFLNRAGQDLVGWTEVEAVGKKWADLIPMEKVDGSRVDPTLRPIMVSFPPGDKEGSTETYYYVRKNGTRFPVSATVTPVVVEGQTTGSVLVFRNVTREKEIEELKEDFLSLATHQLRNPLVTMRWTMEALMDGMGGDVPDEIKKKIKLIYQNNQHMIGLVNDILSVSRISQGRIVEQQQPHDLIRLVENVLTQAQLEAQHRQVKLSLKADDQAIRSKKYMIDPTLLSHCLQNLVSNAIKYSKPGGEVVVRLFTKGTLVCFDVSDQGIGIPQADQPHLFEKFYRGQNASQLDVPGSGLGLFVVKSVVDHWGGTIEVKSEENVGTTVSICAPFKVV